MSCGCGCEKPATSTDTSSSSGMVATTPMRGLPPTTRMTLVPRSAVVDPNGAVLARDTDGTILLREPCDNTVPVGKVSDAGIPGCAPAAPAGPGVSAGVVIGLALLILALSGGKS